MRDKNRVFLASRFFISANSSQIKRQLDVKIITKIWKYFSFTFNEESFLSKEEQFEDILTTVVATVLSYVEKLVSLSSLLRNSEYEIYPFLDSLHIFLHNMARFNGNETTSRTYNSDNMMFVMQNIQHSSNHSEDLTCKKLDFNGVTKNTYERESNL